MRDSVPALCLHGLGVSPRHLRPLVRALAGERDTIVSQPWASHLARLLRGSLAPVPGAAHAAHFTHPDAVVAAAGDFLR